MGSFYKLAIMVGGAFLLRRSVLPLVQENPRHIRYRSINLSSVFISKNDRHSILAYNSTKVEDPNVLKSISELVDQLVSTSDSDKLTGILDSNAALFQNCCKGSVGLELLLRLKPWPQLALQVFDWKKKQIDLNFRTLPEEYTKAITLAGRAKRIDLASDLFLEAHSKGVGNTATYNALMTAYMCNGFNKKTLSLFEDLKRDPNCKPTIATYNILLSVFGRSVLVSHMETVFREIKEANLYPNLCTYNTLIAGYITSWMWYDMEKTFENMEASSVKPDISTHLLMLRGYAHQGSIKKMEEVYELVKDQVNQKEFPLIRTMICAYCRSSDVDRVKKIERLLRYIPEEDYKPWLNVLLIRVYAQEDLIEAMESSIYTAFEHDTKVMTAGVMRSIIASYFRLNALDNLEKFVERAQSAGWRVIRSLYHCKMVMYGMQNRFMEMENVIGEMEYFNIYRTKKTLWIWHKAYTRSGKRTEVEKVLGIMWKAGFEFPLSALPSYDTTC